ncbi:MAG: SulP family inorganic anion transporter, partial [Synechococcaceae cyanobacterium]|nr:SulP family inorganic anion transporter [Synechococcaceae cyanobacterium]
MVTGLYTLVLPMLAYILLGSSRHLVVGADSATAAVMFAGLSGMATAGSQAYIELAGMLALTAAAILLLARLIRLGFLADFLSRTVLIGFLTGVGVQVAAGQVGGMLGVEEGTGGSLSKLWGTLQNIGDTSMATLAVSVSVILVILGTKRVTTAVPGALVAVVGAIAISWGFDLADHGVSTLGPVESGLPSLGLPSGVTWDDFVSLIPTAFSIAVLILAQSAATSRAYAARYNERFSEDHDLVGLSFANAAAGVSGTFVVNGSPTKTQMVDDAHGRSQLAGLACGLVVVIVLLFLTGTLQYLPNAVLASVVFVIGIELVDYLGMRRVLSVRTDEFVVALLTALTVFLIGVEQGVFVAIVASAIGHLRRSYRPPTAVLVRASGTRLGYDAELVDPSARTESGLVVYRFSSSLYYANSNHFLEETTGFLGSDDPPRWLCIDATSVPDIDYTGAKVLEQLHESSRAAGVKLVLAALQPDPRRQLERYGTIAALGPDAVYDSVSDVLVAFDSGTD